MIDEIAGAFPEIRTLEENPLSGHEWYSDVITDLLRQFATLILELREDIDATRQPHNQA